ncbi:MAG: arylesterase [Pseudomonadota bacterium]
MRKAVITFAVLAAGAAQADEVVIAALGDSLTQGFGLPVQEGFVPQLQGWLEAQGLEARVINAGVSGDTTAGGLARVGWTLTPEVDAMIVALGGNDLLRGLDPAQARANIAGILETAAAQEVEVLLVGMQAPGNYGEDYKTAFDALYPDLAAEFDVLHAESFFVGLMQDGVMPALDQMQPFLQSDGIHPNATGVTRIVEGLGPHVARLIEAAEAG